MKKIQERVKKVRKFLILASVVTASAVFLPGCDLFAYKQPFPDAYYENNFIEGIGFDVFAPAPAPGDPAVTGMWDFAYRYLDWDGFPYMRLTDSLSQANAIGSVPSGLSPTASVYRLELMNLIEDGDFESDETANWSAFTGTTTCVWDSSGAVLSGSGSMELSAQLSSTRSFSTALITSPSTPAISVTKNYKAFFEYKTGTGSFTAEVGGTTTPALSGENISAPAFRGTGTPPVFTFAPPTGSSFDTLFVDNFRVTIDAEKKLRLLLTPTETDPDLEWGVYSFSIWVHSDNDVIPADSSPYQIDKFTVSLAPGTTGTLSQESSLGTYSPSAGWQKLTATLKPGSLMFANGSATSVIELILDFNEAMPGQVLLAQPELRFYPDGL